MICKGVINKMKTGLERVWKNDNVLEKARNKGNPTFPKDEPFYCCACKRNTDGLSTCHLCGHMKGRWKTEKHHCLKENAK